MPNARPWRRGQAPQPRSGAPKAQGWTTAPTVAAQYFDPSVAAEHPVYSTGTNLPMSASATQRIHTTLTGMTQLGDILRLRHVALACVIAYAAIMAAAFSADLID
jgi:hypothetical protein